MNNSAAFLQKLGHEVDPIILADLVERISAVETELTSSVRSQVHLVQSVAELTLGGGGKRLRPALVILSALVCDPTAPSDRLRMLATAVELVHMATLVHDDVIDDAATRRGKPTAFSVYGNTASILGGDVMLAKAMAILAEDGDLPIIRTVSQSVVELAEGEVKELAARGNIDLTVEEHLSVLRMKTAGFMECCCRVGAMSANANKETLEAIAAYGHHLGMAFQIADDILDFQGDQAKTGKPCATDFRDGQATLPLIHAMPAFGEDQRQFTAEKFGNGVSESEIAQIIQWMTDEGSFTHASNLASEHVERALSALDKLPHSPHKTLLASVAKMVVGRES
ncbi:polyprenyl synthetase family protein [Kamptonema cortianum]|nr:polyprenyl synthetase family protein [Geitlerinema splendidum]MDK3156138.1 polyprenyl synthetase family protein [Kamptonema cortianum]